MTITDCEHLPGFLPKLPFILPAAQWGRSYLYPPWLTRELKQRETAQGHPGGQVAAVWTPGGLLQRLLPTSLCCFLNTDPLGSPGPWPWMPTSLWHVPDLKTLIPTASPHCRDRKPQLREIQLLARGHGFVSQDLSSGSRGKKKALGLGRRAQALGQCMQLSENTGKPPLLVPQEAPLSYTLRAFCVSAHVSLCPCSQRELGFRPVVSEMAPAKTV